MARPAQGSRRRRSRSLGLTTGMLALGLIAMLSITVGSRDIALADILGALRAPDLGDDRHLVVSLLRMPRTVVAILAGMALGVAGALMQAVTRNPLAEPGLLGVNAGAALAVLIGMTAFDLTTVAQYVWCAFAGAGLAGAAVFAFGQFRGPACPSFSPPASASSCSMRLRKSLTASDTGQPVHWRAAATPTPPCWRPP